MFRLKMFLGHFAVAFAAKRAAPAVSLGTLFLAAQLADLIWPNLARWGAALGAGHFMRKRNAAAAAVLFALVLSHWALDVASHRADMPLLPGGGARLGLGLWSSVAATLAVEGSLFAGCAVLYVRTTRPIDRIGRWSLAALLAFLVAVYLASLFGPAPSSTAEVAWSAQAIWLLVAWGYWIDRHRTGR